MQADRKRQRRKEDRPAEIIAAAMGLWAERGFAATRLEDVAAIAGIAKGTIYLYFPSKEALFEAALKDRLIGTMQAFGASIAQFDGTTEQLFAQFLSAIYDQMLDRNGGVLLKILIAEGHRFPDLVSFYKEHALAQGIATIQKLLERGVARGELRVTPTKLDPRLIMAPVVMAAIWQLVFANGTALDRISFQQSHLDLLMHGIARQATA